MSGSRGLSCRTCGHGKSSLSTRDSRPWRGLICCRHRRDTAKNAALLTAGFEAAEFAMTYLSEADEQLIDRFAVNLSLLSIFACGNAPNLPRLDGPLNKLIRVPPAGRDATRSMLCKASSNRVRIKGGQTSPLPRMIQPQNCHRSGYDS